MEKSIIVRITPELRVKIERARLGDEKIAQTTRRILRESLKEGEEG